VRLERYFAYGSNMDARQMAQRVPAARVLGAARLPGYRLAFTQRSKFGGAVSDVVVADTDEVWGVLYEMPLAVLEHLDAFEGLYVRKQLEVHHRAAVFPAWVYLVREPDLVSALVPRADYLRLLLEGAAAAQLPAAYISQLRAIKCLAG
jgi:gamma-glutamylcyclotransferase